MSVKTAIAKFNATAAEAEKVDPTSSKFVKMTYKPGDECYGRPKKGSLTEKRGIKAGVHVAREILFLCEMIDRDATIELENNQKAIKFGQLFLSYSHYSDKLVGMLLRARKHGLVQFEGEMLYQKQDDNTIIVLQKSIECIREAIKASGDPAHCILLDF